MHERNTSTESLTLPTSLSSAFSQLHLENSASDVARSPMPPANVPDIRTASASTGSTGPDTVAHENIDLSSSISSFERNTFSLFPELPLEIRRMVWRHALPGPRYVELRTAPKSVDDAGQPRWGNPFEDLDFAAVEKAPGLFFTCHEARTEVMKVYQPFKGVKKDSGTVWFDPHTDVLCFRYEYFHPSVHSALLLLDSTLRESLENIAMDVWIISDQWHEVWHHGKDDLVSLLPSLKRFHITDCEDPENVSDVIDVRKGVIGVNEISVPEKIFYPMALEIIMETKVRYPEWKVPVIKPAECVMGLARDVNTGIGLS